MAPRGDGPTPLSVASWVVYDLANTIFALGVVGLYFSDWLLTVGQPDPDSALAAAQVAAAVIVVFLAPWVGARSDVKGSRIPALISTTAVAVAATALLGIGPVWLTLGLLSIALISVNTGSVVYDALLVDVSTPTNRGWVSGLGVGVGYLGSFIGLGIGVVTLDVLGWSHPATFRSIAAAFLVFSLPTFLFVRETPGDLTASPPGLGDITRRLVLAWKTATRYQGVVPFLLGRFLYTDAINTLIGGFLAIFVIDELGLDRRFFFNLMGVAITAAVIGGVGSGRLISRFGPLGVLRAVLVLWILAMTSGIVASATGMTSLAWVIGPVGGLALGATWSSDRVVMARISPPRHLGQFYGLYATVGRFATIAGPLLWATIVDGLGLGRNTALGALAVLVGLGWWVLGRVDDSERVWPEEELVPVRDSPDARPS